MMKYRPSMIERVIAQLPKDMQIECLKTIVEEHDRLSRGDYTEEEKQLFQRASDLGRCAAEFREKLILQAIS